MKTLLHYLTWIVASLLLVACTEVVFEKPLPQKAKTLKKIPKSIQGKYSFVLMASQASLIVGDNYLQGNEDKAYLSDSLILKEVDGKYIFNRKITDPSKEVTGKWSIYIIDEAGCGFLKATTFTLSDKKEKSEFEADYSPNKMGNDRQSYYLLDANDDLFWRLAADSTATLRHILEKID